MALTKVPSNLDAAISVTQSAGDNSTKVATTSYVDTAISALSDSAPAALNTLNEIAAALGDDANYASTTTTAIATKLPLAGGTMTGKLTLQSDSGNEQFVIKRQSAQNEQLIFGFHSSDYATIQALEQSVAYRPLALNPAGGQVGIGTTTPGGKLHVYSGDAGTVSPSSQADDLVVEASTEGGITIMTPNDQSARIRFTSPATQSGDLGGADIFYRQNINKMSIGTTVSGGKLAFKSNAGVETMVLNGGKVGIGTDPDEKLHVAGQVSFEGAGNVNRGNVIIGAHGSGTAKWATLGATHYNDATGTASGTGGAGIMLIGNYSDASASTIYIGGGPYELNPATHIKFNTHSANLHSSGGTTRMMIDSGGNAMIGKTAANTTAAGNTFFQYGRHGVTVNATTCQIINRLGNDGTITLFEKDNAAIGQINVLSGRMGIGSGDTGLFFDSTRDCVAPFSVTANDGRAGIDLGRTGVKFKDAHFSGNVYVDGGLSVYENGSTYRIASQSNETSATVNTYATLKTWKASQSGQFNTTFSAYIQSGSYYFRYRFYNVTKSAVVKMSNNSTDADHFYNANQTGNDGNVHNYQHYSLGLGKIDRGDVIALQMQSANGAGVLQTGNGQAGYARNWKILSAKTPAVERDTGVMERPQIYGASTHTQESNGNGAIMHTVPVALNSGTHTIFSILTGFDQGTVAHASFEFTGLYSYANANSSLGHMTTSIRRASGNSAWTVGAHTNYHETNGGSVSTPSFTWTSSGTLQCIVAGSVQITGILRITTRTVPNYKWGINI